MVLLSVSSRPGGGPGRARFRCYQPTTPPPPCQGTGPVLPISRKKFLHDGNCVTRDGTFIGIGNVLSLSKTSSKAEKNLLPYSLFTLLFSLFTFHLISRGEGPVLPISRKKFLHDGNCVTRDGTFIGIGNVLSLSKTSSKAEKNLLPYSLFTLLFSLFTFHLISRGEGPVLPISRKKFS